jgi:hypothetical protein
MAPKVDYQLMDSIRSFYIVLFDHCRVLCLSRIFVFRQDNVEKMYTFYHIHVHVVALFYDLIENE